MLVRGALHPSGCQSTPPPRLRPRALRTREWRRRHPPHQLRGQPRLKPRNASFCCRSSRSCLFMCEHQKANPAMGGRTSMVSEGGETDRIKYAASSRQGWTLDMEDARVVVPHLDATTNTSFFGVYDGHGGGWQSTA